MAPIWKHEGRELLRGFAGALFVALPLLYTQEMWERAREIPPGVLALILGLAYVVNVGYVSFSSFKADIARTHITWDALISLFLGALASLITLWLTARITTATPLTIQVNLVALMIVPTSFGASLAINQLGKRSADRPDGPAEIFLSEDQQTVLATVLGGVLFAFNIVPTIEPKVMLAEVGPVHAMAIVVFSLIVSYIIEFMARFHSAATQKDKGVLREPWLTVLVAYLVSLITAAGLLWMFGYINLQTPAEMWVIWVIIVGYATTLGGTAGRLIL